MAILIRMGDAADVDAAVSIYERSNLARRQAREEESMMSTVALRQFEAPDLPDVLAWFAHPEQREFARDLPVQELELRRTVPGTDHRGARVLARHAWVADDEPGVPVAFVGAEIYDRPPCLDAQGRPNRPAPTWQGSTAGLMLCVDPARSGQGYGRATLLAVATARELAAVEWLAAGIQRGHLASERCVAGAGFVPAASEPDREGIVHWIASRCDEARCLPFIDAGG